MKITVAIPCYNLEDRIIACLESVISQDFEDMEILVLDDHSTDHSVEVVRNFIEKHHERVIRLIVNSENLGLSRVRNISINEACGEYLYFIDGDDTIEPGTLSLFFRRMEETHADVVCGSFRKMDYDGETIVVKQFPEDTIVGEFAYAIYIERYIHGFFSIVLWNKLYNVDFLRSHQIYCATSYREFESSYFTFKVALYAKCISFIHNITYNYYDVPTSISHQNRKDFLLNYHSIIESVIDAKNEYEINNKGVEIPCGIIFLFNYICLTSGLLKRALSLDISKKDKKKLLKWLRQQYRTNNITRDRIIGQYNKISYTILMSPCPYCLFRYYFNHLKAIAKIINKSNCIQQCSV